jgi:signal transduction histidine kinase
MPRDESHSLATHGQSTEQLQRIQSVTDAALAHLSLDDLLEALLDRIRDALGSDTCAFLLLDESTDELVARAARGIEEEVEQGVRIPVGRGFAGKVAAERRPVIIPDIEHADIFNPILREKGIRSLLGVPLLVHGDVIGVVHVGTLTHREFTDRDMELLQLAADRAALAIEHGRVYEAERALAERLLKLQQVTDVALAHLGLDALLNELLERVRGILEADTCAILLLDTRRNELVARAARGIEEEVERGVRIPVGQGFAGRVAAERRPIVIEDVDHADVLNPILREKGIKSLLGAPLVVRDNVLGVIHVGTLTPRHFGSDDAELLQLAAERAAMGLEKALVHDELMRLDQVRHAFISIASHELRTPATAVLGAALTLVAREHQLSDEQQHELKQVLAEQAQRLATLIEQLLDLSKIAAQALEIRPEPVHIAKRLEQLLRTVAAGRRDAVEIEAPPELEAAIDATVLDRVVSNLVVNALRHGAPPIRVGGAVRDGRLVVTVADDGPGVPPELRGRLFDQFVRGQTASSTGSGLGLAIARSYAQAHGGDLRYVARDRGACFELQLPVGGTGARPPVTQAL